MTKIYSRNQVAEILGVHPKTVTRYVNECRLDRPCTPPGVHPKWTQEAIDNFINARPITKKERTAQKVLRA